MMKNKIQKTKKQKIAKAFSDHMRNRQSYRLKCELEQFRIEIRMFEDFKNAPNTPGTIFKRSIFKY